MRVTGSIAALVTALPLAMLQSQQPRLHFPRDTVLADERISIAVSGLRPSSLVTVRLTSMGPARMAWDPAPTARQVRAPTLILQGATDRQVPPDQAEKLAALIRAGGNRDVTVRVFPATNHLFVDDPDGDFAKYDQLRSSRIRRDVLGTLVDWLVPRMH
jgi:fermentation-respiration switch protein FrsA (DUF1100 family)